MKYVTRRKNEKKILCIAVAIFMFAGIMPVNASAVTLPAPKVTTDTVSSTRINVNWSKVSGAEKYELCISDDGQNGKSVGTFSGLSYTVTNLEQATRYRFTVTPLDITDGKTVKGTKSAVATGTTGGYYQKGRVDAAGEYKETATFDVNGNILAKDALIDGVMDQYTYDDKGNMLSSKIYSSGGWAYWYTYTYDDKGNQTSLARLDDDGSVFYKVVSTFDANGNEITATRYDAKGNVSGSTVNTYDSDGNILTSESKNNDAMPDSKTVYIYDDKGNLLTDGTNAYTYDDAGNILSHDNYNRKIVYTYDTHNNRISEIEYGTDGKLTSKTVSTYDITGNKLTTEYFNAGGASTDKTVYTYDKKGNVLTSEWIANGKFTGKTTYKY